MQTRIIYTNFWLNGVQEDLSLFAQHLYIYLITCPHIGICSVFKLPDQYICLETKMTPLQLLEAKEELTKLNKVRFYKGWVNVVRAEKFVNYKNSPDNMKKYLREVSFIPEDVMTNLSYIIDTTVDSTNKSGIINPKQRINNTEEKTLTDKEVEEINESVPF
jgi:hypothetical protein